MAEKSIEIICTACGEDALVRREPVYEGFKKIGERCFCSACGHEFDPEEIPYKGKDKPRIFTADDASKDVEVFADEERARNCRHCMHYVVNPFVQRCGLHNRFIEATDICGDFTRAEPDNEAENDKD
jgi:hypothetical protein